MDILETIIAIINGNADISILIVSVVVLGLVQLAKSLGFPVKYSPILALVIGIVLSIVYIGPDIKRAILIGIILGLNAVGLWSGFKNTFESKSSVSSNTELNFYHLKNKKKTNK